MIHVYTGNGKGKTTASLGVAVRAAGAGLKVYFCQFIKGSSSSELVALKKLRAVTVEQFGRGCFIKGVPAEADRRSALRGLEKARAAAESGRYDVVILDEINCAVALGLVGIEDMLLFMRSLPPETELVLTGRGAHPRIEREADLVTRMQEKKHYFSRGQQARKGIEF